MPLPKKQYRERKLTQAQRDYCARRARGEGPIHYKWEKHPRVQQYITELHQQVQAVAVYDCAKAMRETDRALDFAYEQGHAMAVVKCLEHRARLAGLLIERIQVESVDLTAALEAARARAQARLINVPPAPELVRIANDPVGSVARQEPEPSADRERIGHGGGGAGGGGGMCSPL